MGLFDQVAAMAGGLAGGGEGGAPGGASAGGLGAIVQMLESQGGVAAVLGRFQQSGLGALASSWRGDGANASVSPEEVQAALGSGPIAEVAQKLGIDPQAAADHISRHLPEIMDRLTPGGRAAEGGAMGGLLGMLAGGSGDARPA